MKKLPKVYVNPIKKNIQNNKQLFYGKVIDEKTDNESILKKINNIFHSRNFVYKKDVLVTTNSMSKVITLVGRTSSSLLSLDNEKILIKDIVDIKEL